MQKVDKRPEMHQRQSGFGIQFFLIIDEQCKGNMFYLMLQEIYCVFFKLTFRIAYEYEVYCSDCAVYSKLYRC